MTTEYGITEDGQVVVIRETDEAGLLVSALTPKAGQPALTPIDADDVPAAEAAYEAAEAQRVADIEAAGRANAAALAPVMQGARNRLGGLGFTAAEVDALLPRIGQVGAVITFDDIGATVTLSGPTSGTYSVEFTEPDEFTNAVDFSTGSPQVIGVTGATGVAFSVKDSNGGVVLEASGQAE